MVKLIWGYKAEKQELMLRCADDAKIISDALAAAGYSAYTEEEGWREIFYKDAWYPEGNTCILTTAEAIGQWKNFKYAIYKNENHSHIAFWPMKPIIKSERILDKNEAEDIINKTVNGDSLLADFRKTYG